MVVEVEEPVTLATPGDDAPPQAAKSSTTVPSARTVAADVGVLLRLISIDALLVRTLFLRQNRLHESYGGPGRHRWALPANYRFSLDFNFPARIEKRRNDDHARRRLYFFEDLTVHECVGVGG
jgi:hypothetical protein